MPLTASTSHRIRLNLQLFGEMQVTWGELPLPAPRLSKGWWLLAMLALRGGQEVSRDWLAGMLWPDSQDALATLRRTLTNLRQVLGPASGLLMAPTTHTLRLDVGACQVDALEFEVAAKHADLASLERAITLYQAPLLESCHVPWIVQERTAYQETFLRVLEQAAAHHRQAGHRTQAISYLRRAIERGPYRESLHRTLMETLREQGDGAEAMLVYRHLRLQLREELNIEPTPETTALYQQIRAQVQEQKPAHSPLIKTAPVAPRLLLLPRPLTPLIGRETELVQIERHLQQARLVTLTGVGGIGKTHLALQAAWEMQDYFADGVVCVELAALSEPERILQTLAAVLDLREDAERSPLALLKEALQNRELLLVLDNCEHLIEACAALSGTLLKACPSLHLLATSRQPLGLTGEVVLGVPPLAVPAEETRASTQAEITALVTAYPAVRLFIERAATNLPAFAVTPQNFPSIIRLCLHLEGIPLALELAAARIKVLSVEQIQARMHNRFGLLSQGRRDALPHQQTLRKMLDWSYDLLTEEEQRLFCRLSVFARGWTLEAAEAVCADLPPAPSFARRGEVVEVLDLLTQLVEKSLVLSEEAEGSRRYRLLETVREYATEKLALSGEQERRFRIHRDYFLALLQQVYAMRQGPGQKPYLQTVEREYENIRAALRFCLCDMESGEKGLWLAGYLQDYWWTRGYLQEGQTFLGAMLQHPTAQEPNEARAFALNGAGVMAWLQGSNAQAAALLEESLSIRRTRDDQRGIALVLGNLGSVYRDQEEFAKSRAYQEESLALFRAMNLPWNIAISLTNLGSAAIHQGEPRYARQCYEEALALRRELNDQRGIAISLCGLGQAWVTLGDLPQALRCYEESLVLLREINERTNLTITLLNLGKLWHQQGNQERAFLAFRESLEICRDTGDVLTSTLLLELARLLYEQQEDALATILLSVSYCQERYGSTALATQEKKERAELDCALQMRQSPTDYETARLQGITLGVEGICRLLSEPAGKAVRWITNNYEHA